MIRDDYLIETKDLIIKKAKLSDWEAIFENLWRHEESARYMQWSVTTSKEDAIARMERTIVFEQNHEYTWFIYEKQSMQAIGFCGLEVIEPGIIHEAGIAIGPKFVNKGYGTQVLKALMNYAKDTLHGKKFLACNRKENIASRKVQMKCGFVHDYDDERVDERTGKMFVMEHNFYDFIVD